MARKSLHFSMTALSTVMVALSLPAVASAHVVVTPNTAKVGDRQLFSVSIPNERETAVTGLRLTIPAGLGDVSPTVQTGWTITTKQDSNKNVTEVDWTGGSIPVGQRDDFTFKAQAPAKAGELDWKAYQTYADGTVVAWDQKPVADAKDDDAATSGPYSVTKVVDDLSSPSTPSTTSSNDASSFGDRLPLYLSLVALVLSVYALTASRNKKPEETAGK